MTDKNLTEIICVVDRSGSMHSIKDDAIGGFNTFLEEQKKNKNDRLTSEPCVSRISIYKTATTPLLPGRMKM